MKKFEFFFEATPNPNAMRFYTGENFTDQTMFFDEPTKAIRSPLAQKLFGFPWAAGVLIGGNFVTVTKQDWVSWEVLASPLASLLEEHLENGEEIFIETQTVEVNNNDTPTVQKIKMFLEDVVRPAVAMDGGDVEFSHFEDGKLYLRMLGACNGCPSSSMTLKEGIETRIRESIPEVTEVLQA